MTHLALEGTFDWFIERLDVARWNNSTPGQRDAHMNCPLCQSDNNLHLTELPGGGATVYCFTSDCEAAEKRTGKQAVIEALGEDDAVLPAAGISLKSKPPKAKSTKARLVATYVYEDEAEAPLHRTHRYEPKRFSQDRYDPDLSQWVTGLDGARLVPFHLPQLLAASQEIWLPDGEKDVLAIEAAGAAATCSPMGMEKWRDEYADYFQSGVRVLVVQDRDGGAGRKGALKVSVSLLRRGMDVQVVEAAEGKDISDHLAAGHSLDEVLLVDVESAADVVTQRVDWLWPGRLALRKLTVMDGAPGLFKSGMTLDVAARISTGRPMPDGYDPKLGPRSVIVITGEDDWEDTVAPRLIAAGCDRSYVHPLHDLSIPDQMDELEALALRTRAVLVVIDPLVAFVPSKYNLYRDQDSRVALKPLAALAGRLGCAVWGLRHVSKMTNIAAKDRGTGSVAIGGAARVNLIVGPDPDEVGRYTLACIKSNLAKSVPSLTYRLDEVAVTLDDGAFDTYPVIVWEGEVDVTADDLGHTEKQGEAITFLKNQFGPGGDIEAKVLQREAAALDIGWKAVQRAGDRLGIIKTKTDFKGGWTWSYFPTIKPPRPLNILSTSSPSGILGAKRTDVQEDTSLPRGPKRTEGDGSLGRGLIHISLKSEVGTA